MRHPHLGHWCGYVAVGKGHPAFGKEDVDLSVHGGVTWTGWADQKHHHKFSPKNPGSGKIWLVGFDCSHGWDISPCVEIALKEVRGKGLSPLPIPKKGSMLPDQTWKDLAFVKKQCERMAEQLLAMGPSGLPGVLEILWESTDKEKAAWVKEMWVARLKGKLS